MKNINNLSIKKGFTLIELLIAASILGIISIVSVKLLFSTVLSRARQNSILTSSEDVRNFVSKLTTAVKEADNVNLISSTELQTDGITCYTFKMESGTLKYASDDTADCVPPSSLEAITDSSVEIYEPGGSVPPIFAIDGSKVDLKLSGKTKDSFGNHEFFYETTVVQRID